MFITRKPLLSALKHALKLVPNRPTHPILACVVLESDGTEVTLRATDLKNYLVITLDHNNTGDIPKFSIAVPAALLTEAVSKLQRDEVILTIKDSMLEVTAESTFKIRTADSDEYPQTFDQSAGQEIDVASDDFFMSLSSVCYAQSAEETKQILCGMNFWSEPDIPFIPENTMMLAATNGHRLAVASIGLPTELEINTTVTGDAVHIVRTILSSRKDLSAESLTIVFDTNHTLFDFGDIQLYARNLEGSYPNYPSLLPQQWEYTIDIDVQEFLPVLEQAQIIATRKLGVITLNISDGIKVLVDSADGDFEGFLATQSSLFEDKTESLQIGFNGKYLIEALKSTDAETVKMKLNSPTSPMVLDTGMGQHLIMPVHLRN